MIKLRDIAAAGVAIFDDLDTLVTMPAAEVDAAESETLPPRDLEASDAGGPALDIINGHRCYPESAYDFDDEETLEYEREELMAHDLSREP